MQELRGHCVGMRVNNDQFAHDYLIFFPICFCGYPTHNRDLYEY